MLKRPHSGLVGLGNRKEKCLDVSYELRSYLANVWFTSVIDKKYSGKRYGTILTLLLTINSSSGSILKSKSDLMPGDLKITC